MNRDSRLPLRVLGVDPGTWNTGWGLIEGPGGSPRALEHGTIRLATASDLDRRLALLAGEFSELIVRIRPDVAAVEAPFHGVNARAALQLAHARGVVLAVLGRTGIAVGEYSPATIKKSVTGNGRAPKVQVQSMVARLLGLSRDGMSADAADALAVALCHAACMRVDLLRKKPVRAGSPR